MQIAVIEGPGWGMGRSIIEKLRKEFYENVEIVGVDKSEPMPHLIDSAVQSLKNLLTG